MPGWTTVDVHTPTLSRKSVHALQGTAQWACRVGTGGLFSATQNNLPNSNYVGRLHGRGQHCYLSEDDANTVALPRAVLAVEVDGHASPLGDSRVLGNQTSMLLRIGSSIPISRRRLKSDANCLTECIALVYCSSRQAPLSSSTRYATPSPWEIGSCAVAKVAS